MLHNLTIGHLDTTLVAERGSRVLKPLERSLVEKHLNALGSRAGEHWILDGGTVEFRNGCVIVPWLGGSPNRVAEEFALRMVRDTGCQVIDREHCRVIEPSQLTGLPGAKPHRSMFAGARRLMRALEKGWKSRWVAGRFPGS